jgi:steroid delta-isomerase-like uncharacterized protein
LSGDRAKKSGQEEGSMADVQTQTETQGEVALGVLALLRDGKINEATTHFAKTFQFNDRGLGLEFTDRKRLAEFFQKTRELYPDSSLQTERILASGDYVVIEWTLNTVLTEPFYGGLTRKVSVSLPAASIVQVENGKITDWTDYYDGLTARRTALAAYFVEWAEP